MTVFTNFDTAAVLVGDDDKVAGFNDMHLKALGRLSDTHTDATDAAIAISADEATENGWFEFTGALTADRVATFPAAFPGAYWVRNSTSGAQTFSAQVASGSNVILLPRDSWVLLRHTGTEFEEISRNLIVLQSEIGDLNKMDTVPLAFVSPVEGRLHRVQSIVTTVLPASACVLTTQIATVTITNGGLTIASAAAVGDRDDSGTIEDGQAAPNTLAIGDRIQITSDGVPATGQAKFIISIEPRIV